MFLDIENLIFTCVLVYCLSGEVSHYSYYTRKVQNPRLSDYGNHVNRIFFLNVKITERDIWHNRVQCEITQIQSSYNSTCKVNMIFSTSALSLTYNMLPVRQPTRMSRTAETLSGPVMYHCWLCQDTICFYSFLLSSH